MALSMCSNIDSDSSLVTSSFCFLLASPKNKKQNDDGMSKSNEAVDEIGVDPLVDDRFVFNVYEI